MQARDILKNLQTHKEEGAEEVLQERLGQVNACDILKGRDLRGMEEKALASLLLQCRQAWQIFGLDVKVKLFDHKLFALADKLAWKGRSAKALTTWSRCWFDATPSL